MSATLRAADVQGSTYSIKMVLDENDTKLCGAGKTICVHDALSQLFFASYRFGSKAKIDFSELAVEVGGVELGEV